MKKATPVNYTFDYFLPENPIVVQEFLDNENHPDFSFYKIGNNVPFFDKDGQIKYLNITDKLYQPQLNKVENGDVMNDLITDIELDEELYIRLLPINKLYQVISVRLGQHGIKNI